jgi:hypothetical protein
MLRPLKPKPKRSGALRRVKAAEARQAQAIEAEKRWHAARFEAVCPWLGLHIRKLPYKPVSLTKLDV